MLTITDLHAAINGKAILQGLSLAVKPGEVHAIMGPNGAGKSTLTKALMGHPACTVTAGSITFAGRNLLDLPTEERSRAGIFVGFQYPVEVPGVNNADFLFTALNARRLGQGQVPLTRADFDRRLDRTLADLGINPVWKGRDLNSGFSGGEKKRNELLQLHILEPSLAVLDETDSGLDIDALRAVSAGINAWMRPDRALVLITHYERLLGLVAPHHVHVLSAGRIVRSGGPELAAELERRGYDGVAG